VPSLVLEISGKKSQILGIIFLKNPFLSENSEGAPQKLSHFGFNNTFLSWKINSFCWIDENASRNDCAFLCYSVILSFGTFPKP
jgi:hypothetical protein